MTHIYLVIVCPFVWDRVSWSLGWPQIPQVTEVVLVLLPLSLKLWYCRGVPQTPYFCFIFTLSKNKYKHLQYSYSTRSHQALSTRNTWKGSHFSFVLEDISSSCLEDYISQTPQRKKINRMDIERGFIGQPNGSASKSACSQRWQLVCNPKNPVGRKEPVLKVLQWPSQMCMNVCVCTCMLARTHTQSKVVNKSRNF